MNDKIKQATEFKKTLETILRLNNFIADLENEYHNVLFDEMENYCLEFVNDKWIVNVSETKKWVRKRLKTLKLKYYNKNIGVDINGKYSGV